MGDTMREKIIEQIKKMQARADDSASSQNEREFALARISRLLNQHSIIEDEIVEKKRLQVLIVMNAPQTLGWVDLFLSAISLQYGCSTAVMLYEDGDKKFDKVVLVGEKLDVEVCLPILQTLVEQAQIRADQLHEWATKRHAELWKEKEVLAKMQEQYFSSTTSSTTSSTSTYNFFSYMSFSMNASVKNVLLASNTMPERHSKTWLAVEKSWGLGLITSLVERIINLASQEDDFDKEHAASFLAAEKKRLAGHSNPGTSLAVRSTALTMQNMLQEKSTQNMKAMKELGGDRYREATPSQDETRIQYPDMFEQGQREGREVQLNDSRAKADAK